jgi:hypothetical protein
MLVVAVAVDIEKPSLPRGRSRGRWTLTLRSPRSEYGACTCGRVPVGAENSVRGLALKPSAVFGELYGPRPKQFPRRVGLCCFTRAREDQITPNSATRETREHYRARSGGF